MITKIQTEIPIDLKWPIVRLSRKVVREFREQNIIPAAVDVSLNEETTVSEAIQNQNTTGHSDKELEEIESMDADNQSQEIELTGGKRDTDISGEFKFFVVFASNKNNSVKIFHENHTLFTKKYICSIFNSKNGQQTSATMQRDTYEKLMRNLIVFADSVDMQPVVLLIRESVPQELIENQKEDNEQPSTSAKMKKTSTTNATSKLSGMKPNKIDRPKILMPPYTRSKKA